MLHSTVKTRFCQQKIGSFTVPIWRPISTWFQVWFQFRQTSASFGRVRNWVETASWNPCQTIPSRAWNINSWSPYLLVAHTALVVTKEKLYKWQYKGTALLPSHAHPLWQTLGVRASTLCGRYESSFIVIFQFWE